MTLSRKRRLLFVVFLGSVALLILGGLVYWLLVIKLDLLTSSKEKSRLIREKSPSEVQEQEAKNYIKTISSEGVINSLVVEGTISNLPTDCGSNNLCLEIKLKGKGNILTVNLGPRERPISHHYNDDLEIKSERLEVLKSKFVLNKQIGLLVHLRKIADFSRCQVDWCSSFAQTYQMGIINNKTFYDSLIRQKNQEGNQEIIVGPVMQVIFL